MAVSYESITSADVEKIIEDGNHITPDTSFSDTVEKVYNELKGLSCDEAKQILRVAETWIEKNSFVGEVDWSR
jgi:hypothetical protein